MTITSYVMFSDIDGNQFIWEKKVKFMLQNQPFSHWRNVKQDESDGCLKNFMG